MTTYGIIVVIAVTLFLAAPSTSAFARAGGGSASSFLGWGIASNGVVRRGGGGFQAPATSSTTSSSDATTIRKGAEEEGRKKPLDTPEILRDFTSKQDYLDYMQSVAALPKGFATGTAQGKFIPIEAPSMGELSIRGTVIYLTEGPTDNWAAVFTRNKFPGAPVIVGRSRVEAGNSLHAVVINNKVSNVCSGGDGVGDSEAVCAAVADALELPGGAQTVLPSSTGVIGWRLPAKEICRDVIPVAVDNLQPHTALDAAAAICTTDRYPKVRSRTLSDQYGNVRIVGIAKGAGMIEPNMATMLAYIMTDATLPKDKLQSMLNNAVNRSFNSISVDGDESTSDTAVLIASNQIPIGVSEDDDEDGSVDGFLNEFEIALNDVCRGLATDLVRNGEGTGHVMRVTVNNYPGGSDEQARLLGKHVVNSPLFKCAVAGNDPNTGRLAGAIGSFMGKQEQQHSKGGFIDNVSGMKLSLGGRIIFANGKFVLEGDKVEKELSEHMRDAQYNEELDYPPHQRFVDIIIDFDGSGDDGGDADGDGGDNNNNINATDNMKGTKGGGSAVIYGSDLTSEYVRINCDYRS